MASLHYRSAKATYIVSSVAGDSGDGMATSFALPPPLNSVPSFAFCAMHASTQLACSSISGVGKVSARASMPMANNSPGRPHGGA
eukprot:1804847-Pleurochrysis_carterae.AAC.2